MSEGSSTVADSDLLLCEFCDEPCSDGAADPYLIGLDGRAAHNRCLTAWRDDNPVPEEEA